MPDPRDLQESERGLVSDLQPTREAREAFLCGQYDALGWVLTSPRVNGTLRDAIRGKALDIHDELRAMGVKFE